MRKYFCLAPILLCLSLATCGSQSSQLNRELAELLVLLPGTYSGSAPVPGATDGSTQVIHHKIAPVEAPQFGVHVFYYQLSTGGPDGQALQQKIFAFDTPARPPGNRMRAWILAPGQAAANLEQRRDEWGKLDPEAMLAFPDACAFVWSAASPGFEAVVTQARCTFDSRGFGQAVSPDMRYAVFPDRFEWEETLYGADGGVLASTGGNLVALRD